MNTGYIKAKLISAYLNVVDGSRATINYISEGSANTILAVAIVSTATYATTTTLDRNKVDAVLAVAKITQIKADEAIRVARINAAAQVDITMYQAKAEEARASVNPYIITTGQSKYPVNVYNYVSVSEYVVAGGNDGATEIAISPINVDGIKYNPEQRKLLTMAYHIGAEVGFPETIQSLLLQETLAGAYGDRIGDTSLPIGKRSYGVMQMKVATTRKVLRNHPELVKVYFPKRKTYKRVRDEEIIIRLIQDDEFNIRLATLNFVMHRERSKSWAQAVVGYNTGQSIANRMTAPKEHKYYGKILQRLITEVRPFNRETKLSI